LELQVSAITFDRLLGHLERPEATVEELHHLAGELAQRAEDELSVKYLRMFTAQEAELLNNPRKGWEVIIARFPAIIENVEAASKCLALSLFAEAVFNSVQIIEIGLLELGRFLNVTDPHSGWTAVTNALKKIHDKPYRDRTEFERQHFEFLEQVHGTVGALKDAWRNKISHAQGKLILLTSGFSQEIAEEILSTSRGFMRRLATELPAETTE